LFKPHISTHGIVFDTTVGVFLSFGILECPLNPAGKGYLGIKDVDRNLISIAEL
jgi:hypothetical protein